MNGHNSRGEGNPNFGNLAPAEKHCCGCHESIGIRAKTGYCAMCARLRKLASGAGVFITKAQVLALYARQYGRCLGCQRDIELSGPQGSPTTACVDHNHETKEVRGLLCRRCNLAIGGVLEDRQTLQRLDAYLGGYDRSKINVYLIGSLRNPEIPNVANKLRDAGYDVFDEWFSSGEKADDAWQEYCNKRGFTYKEALAGRHAQHVFALDRAYLDLSDVSVMVLPAGKSASLELGYTRGKGKPAFILLNGADEGRYEIMPNVATAVCRGMDELLFQLHDKFGAPKLKRVAKLHKKKA